MIVKNNSTTRAWGVGQVILNPGATQTCEDKYYDDISANPDLSVTSGDPGESGKRYDSGDVTYDIDPVTNKVTKLMAGSNDVVADLSLGSASTSVTYAPTAGFAKWKAAKLRGASNPARHLFYGDSNGAGEGAGTNTLGLDGAFPLGMSSQFATLAGHRNVGMAGDQNITTGSIAINTYDPRIVLGTGWAPDTTPTTLGGRFFVAPAASSGAFQFTPTVPFDSFEYYMAQASVANTAVVVKVDGVTVATVNQAGSNNIIKRTVIGLTLAMHIITVEVGATGTGYAPHIIIFDSTNSQPVMIQGCWCGAKAVNMALSTLPYHNLNAAYAVSPDFTSIYCTINDVKVPTAGATYYSDMEIIVAKLSAISDGCLIVGFPCSAAGVTNGALENYANELRNLAIDYGWALYDSRAVFGRSYVKATAKLMKFDADHPNLLGHQSFAAGYYAFLQGIGF